MTQETTPTTGIAVFGPSSSGKTSLLLALHWKLAKDAGNMLDSRMKLSLLDEKGESISRLEDPPVDPPEPTANLSQAYLTIQRSPTIQDDYAQQASAFAHTLNFVDAPGWMYAEAADKKSINQIIIADDEASRVWKRLQSAPGIVVLLDFTLIQSKEAAAQGTREPEYQVDDVESEDRLSSQRQRRMFTKTQYARLVASMKWLSPTVLVKTPDGREIEVRRRIAICLTKCDQLSNTRTLSNPKLLIEDHFSEQMINAVKELVDHFKEENVGLFPISALGWNPRYGNRANYNSAKKWLDEPELWSPEVHHPFFWLLEGMERDILSEVPRVPFFVRKDAVRDSRLLAYIPYLKRD